jgi:DoxX-like family
VKTLIRRDVDDIWRYTQEPNLHELWDLRFSAIEYLPRESDQVPQRFRYTTRIGFGLRIEGEGESAGNREDSTGSRTSALKFRSADPKSLIREGSGYWRYIPVESGTRFLTWYDYEVRFGVCGRVIDRLLFRPLLGWATAWSFDRLRLWMESGVAPRHASRFFVIHALARAGIAFVWFWQGLVPKLLWRHADEQAMIVAAGLPIGIIPLIGAAEVIVAVIALLFWRWRGFFVLNVLAMAGALIAVGVQAPGFLVSAFNAVTLNLCVAVLAIIGHLASHELPSATRCLRRAAKEAE